MAIKYIIYFVRASGLFHFFFYLITDYCGNKCTKSKAFTSFPKYIIKVIKITR